MKFLHLGDLHLGKKVNDISMLDEQKFVLEQIFELIQEENINAVFIAGDVFDRAVPNIFALKMFSDFLSEINKLNVSSFIISGNHDNSDRLAYLTPLLKQSDIFISKPFEGKVEYIDFSSDYRIYLLPYLYPALVKNYFPDIKINDYNDAVEAVIKTIKLDKNKINIILSHQFVSGITMPQISQSEQKSVGGVDIISSDLFNEFDYTALGHLHCPQKISKDNIRYSGSILKYSFSEINQKKVFTIIEFDENKNLKLKFKNIVFKHDLKEYRGYIKEFLDEKFYSKIKTDDYIHFILLDENVLDAKKTLSVIYPNIMLLEFDNEYTRNLEKNYSENFNKDKTLLEHFKDFYKLQINSDIDLIKEEIVKKTINEALGGDINASL